MNNSANVLVVDDDAGGRYLKAHILRKCGYKVTEAATGQAAIEHCCVDAPDLVLLDVRLPDIRRRRGLPADQSDLSRRRRAADLGGDHQSAGSCAGAGRRRRRLPDRTDRTRRTAGDRARAAAYARRGTGTAPAERDFGAAGRGTHARADRSQPTAGSRGRRTPQDRGSAVAHAETGSWSVSSPAASRTTSTTCSR